MTNYVKVYIVDRRRQTESVFAEPVDVAKDLYRIANVPLLSPKPTYGDEVVATVGKDGALVFRRVHASGGYQVEALRYAKPATFKPLVAWLLAEHGAVAEGCVGPTRREPGLLLVAVPRRERIAAVVAAAKARFQGVFVEGEQPTPAQAAVAPATAALHAAIAAGDVRALKRALRDGGSLVRRVGAAGDTALVAAAKRGTAALVRALLAAGAAPNARNDFRQTAAYWSGRRGDVAMLRALCKSGADPLVRDETGTTALHYATTEGLLPMVRALLALGANPNDARNRHKAAPLHGAAVRDRPAVARALLSAGGRIGARDTHGFTPLMDAAHRGSTATARVLCAHASPRDRDDALRIAAAEGHVDVARALLRSGADPTKPSAKGNTAEALAKQRRKREIIALFATLRSRPDPRTV